MRVTLRIEELDAAASTVFLTVPLAIAMQALAAARIPPSSNLMEYAGTTLLGVSSFNRTKIARKMPNPFTGTVGDYLEMSVTPLTRAAYGSLTAMAGATKVPRDEMVVLCATRSVLKATGSVLVYVDRMCSRRDARFDGDPGLLTTAPWSRIRRRDIRGSTADPEDLARYDAAVLIWGGIPTSALGAIVCSSEKAATQIGQHWIGEPDKLVVSRDLFW